MKAWAYVALAAIIAGILGTIGYGINEYSAAKERAATLAQQNQQLADNYKMLNEALSHHGEVIKTLDATLHDSERLARERHEALYARLVEQQADLKKLKELAENDEAVDAFLREHFPAAIYCFMFPGACGEAAGGGEGTGAGEGAGAPAAGVQGRGAEAHGGNGQR